MCVCVCVCIYIYIYMHENMMDMQTYAMSSHFFKVDISHSIKVILEPQTVKTKGLKVFV